MMHKKAQVVSKSPCPLCRAKGEDRKGDNLVNYSDGNSFCFKCDKLIQKNSSPTTVKKTKTYTETVEMPGIFKSLKDRRISEEILRKFNVTVEVDAQGNITQHYYPYYKDESVVGYKTRNVANKSFFAKGNISEGGLFGQNVWNGGGKYITITEGELDALAVSEMFDGKWPVVSLKTGAGGAVKDIKENLEWLETFENIVICFDQDSPGKQAAQNVLPLFSHGKVKTVSLPLKDAGDMLKEGRVQDFISSWWNAKQYRPVDIVSLSDESCWEAFIKRGTEEITPFPEAYGTLNAMMNGGISAGEVTVIGALTSVGKSTMVYNLLYGMVTESNKKIGAVFLEADKGEMVERLISLHGGENISLIPINERDNTVYRELYEEFIYDDKVHFVDHQGSSDVDELFGKMRWMVKGMDCDVIILDPLQAAVQSNENGTIDTFMDRCLKLAKETGVSIIIVSHMRKPVVKDPHDVNEYDMKGSGSINQIAFNTILLSRDKMSEDDYARNSTKVQLVKCRRTGRTGHAGWLFYEETTGRMVAGTPPEVKAVENEEF